MRQQKHYTLTIITLIVLTFLCSCGGNKNSAYFGVYKNEQGVSIELLESGDYILTNNGLAINSASFLEEHKGYEFGREHGFSYVFRDKALVDALTNAGMDLTDTNNYQFGKMQIESGASKAFLVSGGVLYFKRGNGVFKKDQ